MPVVVMMTSHICVHTYIDLLQILGWRCLATDTAVATQPFGNSKFPGGGGGKGDKTYVILVVDRLGRVLCNLQLVRLRITVKTG